MGYLCLFAILHGERRASVTTAGNGIRRAVAFSGTGQARNSEEQFLRVDWSELVLHCELINLCSAYIKASCGR